MVGAVKPVEVLQLNIFTDRSKAILILWIICVFLCFVFLMLSRLFIAALWSPAGKGLTSWLLLLMFIVFFVTFPCGILGQVWYLIVSFPDFAAFLTFKISVPAVGV